MIDQCELIKYRENYQRYRASDSLYQNSDTRAELPYGDKTVPSLEAGNALIRTAPERRKAVYVGQIRRDRASRYDVWADEPFLGL